eukprot:snap_masked-scaffold_3-processed-gene-6.18-mRNA-1 protein AED:1.00 eAED:1.00 QI:0/-1/0/0/-1/1/1/0/303
MLPLPTSSLLDIPIQPLVLPMQQPHLNQVFAPISLGSSMGSFAGLPTTLLANAIQLSQQLEQSKRDIEHLQANISASLLMSSLEGLKTTLPVNYAPSFDSQSVSGSESITGKRSNLLDEVDMYVRKKPVKKAKPSPDSEFKVSIKESRCPSEAIMTKNFCVDLAAVPASLRAFPEFVQEKLATCAGVGEFKQVEILVLLLVAGEVFLVDSVYSKIKAIMQSRRTRASIRRKIEKLVQKDAGFFGGLLRFDRRVTTRKILRAKFFETLQGALNLPVCTENMELKKFALRLQRYVQENKLLSFEE